MASSPIRVTGTYCHTLDFNRISAIRPDNFASVRLNNHEIGSAAKRIGTVVHLLAPPTQGLCSNPRYQSKGHHVPLRMWFLEFKPRARNRYKRLQHAPFLEILAREILSHQPWEYLLLSLYCGGYFIGMLWQMRCQMKAYDPRHRFRWSAADQITNNVLFEMADSLV